MVRIGERDPEGRKRSKTELETKWSERVGERALHCCHLDQTLTTIFAPQYHNPISKNRFPPARLWLVFTSVASVSFYFSFELNYPTDNLCRLSGFLINANIP